MSLLINQRCPRFHFLLVLNGRTVGQWMAFRPIFYAFQTRGVYASKVLHKSKFSRLHATHQFLGTFTFNINERSIKWLDPLILSHVCKYDMTDYYQSWVKTRATSLRRIRTQDGGQKTDSIHTLHKILSFCYTCEYSLAIRRVPLVSQLGGVSATQMR